MPFNQMKELAIIGLGNQGESWALNLKDSGWDVLVIARPESSSWQKAKSHHIPVVEPEKLSEKFQTPIAVLTPDHSHISIVSSLHEQHPGKRFSFIFAHGYAGAFKDMIQQFEKHQFLLFAPKAIGHELRKYYLAKKGLGAVYSLEHVKENKENYLTYIQNLSAAMGINVGPFEVTWEQETISDLFSEQAFLCTLLPYACLEVYKKLRNKGIPAEAAYLESWFEVKLIADTLIEVGPAKFFSKISPNALMGAAKAKEKLVSSELREKLDDILADIESGKFSKWVDEQSFEKIKSNLTHEWEQEEFQSVHNKLAPQLFK